MTTTAPAAAPGSMFDIPGIQGQTQFFNQNEDTVTLNVPVNPVLQRPVTGIADFRRTDVLFDWRLVFDFTGQVFTAGTGQVLTVSDYAPYNVVGPVQLQIQNQYSSVNVESGIDLYILSLIRPYARTAAQRGVLNNSNPAGAPVGFAPNNDPGLGYLYGGTPEHNELMSPGAPTAGGQWSLTRPGFQLYLDLPGGVWLDEYYALSIDGNYLGAAPDVFVSPQYMAGTQRLIKPSVTMNPLLGPTTDVAPVQTSSSTAGGDTPSTAAMDATLSIRRRGVYGSSSTLVLPPSQPWQYSFTTQRFGLSGVSQAILNVPDQSGQVLSTYLRLYDPSFNPGPGVTGLALPLGPAFGMTPNAITMAYGSGLTWFQGTIDDWFDQWLQQRGFLLPRGTIAFDFAVDEQDRLTNKRALNTYTTAGIQYRLNFDSPMSPTTYAVMGVESLVYVTG